MYAQQIEGESWKGEKMDRVKIDKMSGESFFSLLAGWVGGRLFGGNGMLIWCALRLDQQLGQLYELMNAIREKEMAENDPEHEQEHDSTSRERE